MADKIEITEAPQPAPQPTLNETQIQMAVEYGRMTKAFESNQTEMMEVKASQTQTQSMLSEALAEIRSLRSQTDSISRQEEQLKESQTAIISAVMEDSEKEDSNEALQVTPPMETHIEIDQKPANRPNLLQRIIFGTSR